MSDKENIMLYVLIAGSLHRYLLETSLNATLSATDGEWKRKVDDLFFGYMPQLKGKAQILDYEVLDISILRSL